MLVNDTYLGVVDFPSRKLGALLMVFWPQDGHHPRFRLTVPLVEIGLENLPRSIERRRADRGGAVPNFLQRRAVVFVDSLAAHQSREHGGDPHGDGDPIFLNDTEDDVRLEAAFVDVTGTANQESGQDHRVNPPIVKQRKGAEHHVIVAHVSFVNQTSRDLEIGVVGKKNALGNPVVPLVYIIKAALAGSTSTDG